MHYPVVCSKRLKTKRGEGRFYTEQPGYSHSQRALRGELGRLQLFSTQRTTVFYWVETCASLPLKLTNWDVAHVHFITVITVCAGWF